MSSADPVCDELSFRSYPPAHYVARINPVTELLKLLKLREFKFGPFEVWDYKWWLQLKLTTHEKKEYMSLYLVIDETNKLGRHEVLVDYRFFVFDYNRKEYAIFRERWKKFRKFSQRDTRWGFSKFLSLDDFNKPRYCKENRCKIGAELLVSKSTRREAMLTIKNPSPTGYTKKSIRFSASESSPRYSEDFRLEERSWKLKVCPLRTGKGRCLSVHLEAQGISSGELLFVEAFLRVLNIDPGKDKKCPVKGWLNANNKTCGEPSFMPWGDLNGGFIHWNEGNEQNELKLAVKILTIIKGTRTDEPIG